jgi:hypothetical protein
MSSVHWTHTTFPATLEDMTTTQRTQPTQTSFDELSLSLVPVVLGGPSLRRTAGKRRRPTTRRPATPAGSPALHPSDRDRLSTPR